jgi:hypothetical protein
MEGSPLLFMLVAAVAAVVTAVAMRSWYRRQVLSLASRLDKSERARQYALHQGSQARKQVEKLQRELSESRRPVAAPAPRKSASPERPASAPEACDRPADLAPQPSARPPRGFADTMPL